MWRTTTQNSTNSFTTSQHHSSLLHHPSIYPQQQQQPQATAAEFWVDQRKGDFERLDIILYTDDDVHLWRAPASIILDRFASLLPWSLSCRWWWFHCEQQLPLPQGQRIIIIIEQFDNWVHAATLRSFLPPTLLQHHWSTVAFLSTTKNPLLSTLPPWSVKPIW